MSLNNLAGAGIRVATHLRSSKIPTELLKTSTSYLSAAPSGGKHVLPDLPYDYGALEPCISETIMNIHHTKHHNTYVTNLNAGLETLDAAVTAGNVSDIIALQGALKFNGGGHINHTLFWENLSPKGSTTLTPGGPLATAIEESFGGLDQLKKDLSVASIGVQGSGWGWLGFNSKTGALEVATCANQDPLQATTGLIPIIGIDVWEHAYYLDYKNVRPNYVNAIWDVVNWDVAEKRLAAARK